MTKFAVLIPDRNDRPEFLKNCLRMIDEQTVKPTVIQLVNFEPTDNECDITKRYKFGYNLIQNAHKDIECIFFIENDDYYCSEYFEIMLNEWKKREKPEIFGTAYTIYYHIGLLKSDKFIHFFRASAMNTLIKTGLNIQWPVDNEPYTDIHLWKQLKGVTFTPEKIISIGIKHNVGKTGGQYHNTKLQRYQMEDPLMMFLRNNMDLISFNFYKSIHEKICSNFN